jgi:hypothetical protein
MGEKRNAYRLLVGKPEGKRPLGRPRCKWLDNIRMDLGEIGVSYKYFLVWSNFCQNLAHPDLQHILPQFTSDISDCGSQRVTDKNLTVLQWRKTQAFPLPLSSSLQSGLQLLLTPLPESP